MLPLLWLIALLQAEFVLGYQAVSAYLAEGTHRLPDFVAAPSVDGRTAAGTARQIRHRPGRGAHPIGDAGPSNGWANSAIWSAGWAQNAVKLGFAVLTVLFIYRDGESLLDQVRRVLRRFLGRRIDGYIAAIGTTTKAVLYGLVLTAFAQGALAGVGYWFAGVRAPVLFGAFTALIALMPFGTPFVWGSLGAWLLFTGKTLEGIGLLLWGTLVVSWVDNLIRPLVISSATQIPFLLVMFGVIGGLASFGLIGMFLGPVIVAVLMAVWREWLEDQGPASPGAPQAD